MAVSGIDKDYIKAQIDSARDYLGRYVTVNARGSVPCIQCTVSGYFDSLSGHSFFINCPECNGMFFKDVFVATEVLARIHWTDREAITATPGGKYYVGDATLGVDPSYQVLMESAQTDGNIVVDGQTMLISKINPVGAPTINRLRIILKGGGDRPTS